MYQLTQQHRRSGTKYHAPEALTWRKRAACHRNDESIVAGQENIDPDDLREVHPELRVTDFGTELSENTAAGRTDQIRQPVQSRLRKRLVPLFGNAE